MLEPDFRPALRHDLLRRRIGHEAVVWSPLRHEPLALDPVATVMLDVIDGSATLSELADDVHEVVGVSRDVAQARVVKITESLDRGGALATSDPETVPERQRELFVNPPSS